MEKEWFIFKDDHHTGPFCFDDIKKMMGKGELIESDLLWKEGLTDWMPAKVFLQHLDEIKTPPIPKPKKVFKFPIIVDTPPSIFILEQKTIKIEPTPVEEQEIEPEPEPEMEMESIPVETETVSEIEAKKVSLGPSFVIVVPALIFTLVLLYQMYFLFKPVKETKDFASIVSKTDQVRLDKVMRLTLVPERPKIDLALDNNKQGLVIVSNHSGRGNFEVLLKSREGKVIGIGPSYLSAQFNIENHWAHVADFTFTRGVRLYPGYYDVYIKGKFWDDRSSIHQFLSTISFLKPYLSPSKGTDVEFQSQILFTHDSLNEFNKKLLIFNEKLEELKNFKNEGKLESYRTYKSLLDQIMYHFKDVAAGINRGYEIYRFEAKYSKTIGPVLRSLILDTRKQYMEKRDKAPKEAQHFQSLFQSGRKIGEIVSDLVTETEKIKIINEQVRANLIEKYDQRFNKVKLDLDRYAQNIKILNEMDHLDASIFMHGY